MGEVYGLVLEGGGVRGAFTAGALAWLNDHNIAFDYNVGISSGAVYLTCYLMGNKTTAYNMSVNYACDPENVGIRAFKKEGHYVAYKHIFSHYLKDKEGLTMKPLRDAKPNMEVGAYDLELGRTVFYGPESLDDDLDLLRGTCALPIASAIVTYQGRQLLDGGITKMIPIERALEKGCTKCLIITTKPKDYVRKPAPWPIKALMKMCCKDYPQISADYKVRHINYYKQIDIINHLVEEGNGLLVYPSETINVSRWKGDHDNCAKLYQLGYDDMEKRKEEIFAFLKGETE